MKRLFLFIILLFLYFSNAFGEPLTLDAFLREAENDSQLKDHDELAAYIKDTPVNTPYLDKIEFRTETREFDITKQKYSIRFYPRGWGETECDRKVAETMQKALKAEHDALFHTILQKRYALALDFLESLSLLNMKKMLLIVYDDQATVLKKMSLSDLSFDIKMLVSAEERYTDIRFELAQLENRISAAIDEIKTIAGYYSEILFDEKEIIKPDEIEKMVQQIRAAPDYENMYIKYQAIKTELAKDQYELEKAKSKEYISFINLGYDTDEYDHLEKSFSIEAGFNLPFVKSDMENIISGKKSYMEEKLKYETEKKAFSEKISLISASLERLIRQHQSLANRESESNSESSLKKYSKIEGIDPLTLLKIRESILKSDIRLNELCWLIRRQYTELINITGRMSEKPLKNYLKSS